MRPIPSQKGSTVIIDTLIALAILLAVGVAFNIIGETATKK